VKIRLCGDGARLVELADGEEVTRVAVGLEAHPLPGISEVVPGARTVLLVADPAGPPPYWSDERMLAAEITARRAADAVGGAAEPVEVPVVYDGMDLADVARRCGLTVTEVARRHAAGRYVVAFTGFSPGFGYLRGLDPALHVPRHAEPRTRVPAGAVAIGGEFTGVYPRESPGGWQVIGHTALSMFDPGRRPPALLTPLRPVRFVARELP
jgi:KipI family sensor histidine kinase inhibitor